MGLSVKERGILLLIAILILLATFLRIANRSVKEYGEDDIVYSDSVELEQKSVENELTEQEILDMYNF